MYGIFAWVEIKLEIRGNASINYCHIYCQRAWNEFFVSHGKHAMIIYFAGAKIPTEVQSCVYNQVKSVNTKWVLVCTHFHNFGKTEEKNKLKTCTYCGHFLILQKFVK